MKKTNIGSASGEKILGTLKDFMEKAVSGVIPWESWQVFRNLSKRQHELLANRENPFSIPAMPEDQVVAWKLLYQHFFGMEVDFKDIKLPKEKDDFTQLIIVPEGMKMQTVYDKLAELFPYWKYTDKDLDEAVPKNDRTPDKTYAIRVRDRVEADEEFQNKSAEDLAKGNHASITLLERLLLELFHYWKTGEHLDVSNVTLCAGSRDADGSVPSVYWYEDKLKVHWYDTSYRYAYLRSREAVSA